MNVLQIEDVKCLADTLWCGMTFFTTSCQKLYTPDGSSVGEMPVNLWNISTSESVATFFGHTRSINSLAFSADGTVLASGSCDGTIVLWDMKPYL